MGYTDAQGRPELVMHTALKRGGAVFRRQDNDPAGGPDASVAAADNSRPVAARAGQESTGTARP